MRPGRTARVERVTHIAVAVDRQLAAKIVVAAGVIPSSATTGGVAQIALVAVDEAIVLVSRHQHREVVDPGVEAVAVRRAAVHVHLVFAGVVVAVNAVRAIKTAPLGLVGTAVRGVRRCGGVAGRARLLLTAGCVLVTQKSGPRKGLELAPGG